MEDDIITLLHQNGVTHFVEEIFSYLDYGDTKSAVQVSRNWRHILANSRVWKNLWDRNIANLPAWNSLYKRAVFLQTFPEWNHQEACRVVGDADQKLQRNVKQGRYTEKVDNESKSFLCEISSTKVVTAGNSNQIHVQNRWRLNEEATSFDIAVGSHRIYQLEINEPYLVSAAYESYPFPDNCSVVVFDLEKAEKIHEFTIQGRMDNMWLASAIVKCNCQVLMTCCYYENHFGEGSYATLLTARQMPCSAHLETDFPVIDELNIRGLLLEGPMFLEDQRIVILAKYWIGAFILSIKPLRIIRQYKGVDNLSNAIHWCRREKAEVNYWNGWLLQSNGHPDNDYFPRIRIMNIDTDEPDMAIHIKHLGFDIVNKHLVILCEESHSFLKFGVWNMPQSNGSMYLLYSIHQLHQMGPEIKYYDWNIRFDGIQFWICSYRQQDFISSSHAMLTVRDYACGVN